MQFLYPINYLENKQTHFLCLQRKWISIKRISFPKRVVKSNNMFYSTSLHINL